MSKILNQVIEDYECLYEWEIRKKEEVKPKWIDKEYEQEIATKEEQQEMEDLLNEFK